VDGHASRTPGVEGASHDNLFNNSVVALDVKTGARRWHFQTVHHDIWAHDLSTPLVLYDASIGGRMRKVLAAVRTDGVSFFLDRETGRPILPVDERPVKQDAFLKTSATQPFTPEADRIGPECVDERMIPPGFVAGCYFDPVRPDMPNVLMPHMNMRQSPMAYSPQTGYLYATAYAGNHEGVPYRQREPSGHLGGRVRHRTGTRVADGRNRGQLAQRLDADAYDCRPRRLVDDRRDSAGYDRLRCRHAGAHLRVRLHGPSLDDGTVDRRVNHGAPTTAARG
jgi:hypothetical protein